MEFKTLYTTNRQLNYDEAVRRIVYWTEETCGANPQRAYHSLRLLVKILQRERDNLYFESR